MEGAGGMEYKIDLNLAKWQKRTASDLTFGSDDLDESFTSQHQHLQYFPKKDPRTLRRLIPAKWPEVLSYYRAYVTATYKTQIVSMQYVQFNRFLWYYLSTVFFKSLPHTYIQVFLASYAKDNHFFVPKMVPLVYGIIFIYILTAFSEVIMLMDSIILQLDYTIYGFINKNPWNRCDVNISTHWENEESVYCYVIDEFTYIFKSHSPIFNKSAYKVTYKSFRNDDSVFVNASDLPFDEDYKYFHISSVTYYVERFHELLKPFGYITKYELYFIFLWLLINVLNYQLFKRFIWRAQYIVQWCINVVYLCIFLHLVQDHFFGQWENKAVVPDVQERLSIADYNMLAESMTTPPIIHILSSRSSREIGPNEDSSVIIISNGLYFIFKGLLSYRLKKYCDSLVQVPIYILDRCPNSFFYIWPIYFTSVYFGDFFTVVFFCLHFLMDFCTITITYQCLIEATVCEWRLAKRVIVTTAFLLIGLIMFHFTSVEFRMEQYVYTKGTTTMLDIIAIYVVYPIDRLIDDITFYTGVTPTWLRVMNLRLVPFYYGLKLYVMYSLMIDRIRIFNRDSALIIGTHATILISLIIGTIYACVNYVCLKKKSWKTLIIPDSSWGPEFSVRQMRKEYDSREYIASQAPRSLSRYMIQKAEAKKYYLNIKYDTISRRSTAGATSSKFKVENEKKNV